METYLFYFGYFDLVLTTTFNTKFIIPRELISPTPNKLFLCLYLLSSVTEQ